MSWHRRRLSNVPPFPETEAAVEYAISDDDGATFGPEQLVALTNPQAEPPATTRGRNAILNAPFITVDPGNGCVYITYFGGKTPFGVVPRLRAADIFLTNAWANVSRDNGLGFGHDKLQSDVSTTSYLLQRQATQDTIFTIANGLGVGNDKNALH